MKIHPQMCCNMMFENTCENICMYIYIYAYTHLFKCKYNIYIYVNKYIHPPLNAWGMTKMAFHKTIGFMKCMNHVEFFIKCSDKTRNPYKMQTRHFLSFLWNATSLQITSPYTNSLSQHVLIKCQNLSSQFLTFIKTTTFIKCLNRVPKILKMAHIKNACRIPSFLFSSLFIAPSFIILIQISVRKKPL